MGRFKGRALSSGVSRPCADALAADVKREKYSVHNPSFLHAVRQELKAHDSSGCGLVSLSTFSLCLAHMGVAYGSPEADFILRFCDVLEDGFVLYKALLLETDPYRKNYKDSVSLSLSGACPEDRECLLAPETHEGADVPEESRLTEAKGIFARKLFAKWERCLIRDHELKELLVKGGFRITPEFESLIATQGPGGAVTFNAFVRALMADKARGHGVSRQVLERVTAELSAERMAFVDPSRDIVSWGPHPSAASTAAAATDELLGPAFVQDTPWNQKAIESLTDAERRAFLLRLVSLFLAEEICSERFRNILDKAAVAITPEIDACIREHSASGELAFGRIMGCIWKADAQRQNRERQEG